MIQKQDRKYVVVFALSVLLLVAVELAKPTPIDWTLSLQHEDQRPYGGLILYDLLDELFPASDIQPVDLPPYLVAQGAEKSAQNYIFTTGTFAPDPAETDALLEYTARGNTLFVSAYRYTGLFADTLHLKTRFVLPTPSLTGEEDSLLINFVNPVLRADTGYGFKGEAAADYFSRFDTSRTTVLGMNSEDEANFIRVAWGEGEIYLHTVPLAFSNYYLLYRDNAAYAYRALSYLPDRDILWDEYYKPNRPIAQTPLRFVLQDPALKNAYWILIALVLLFMFFEAKRRQRIIPVITPPRNATLEFAKTVGHLYFHHGDHANLAEKKITYFLDYIRTHLRLPTSQIDDAFLNSVAERAGMPEADVRAIFATVSEVEDQKKLSEDALQRLNRQIEAFYRNSKR